MTSKLVVLSCMQPYVTAHCQNGDYAEHYAEPVLACFNSEEELVAGVYALMRPPGDVPKWRHDASWCHLVFPDFRALTAGAGTSFWGYPDERSIRVPEVVYDESLWGDPDAYEAQVARSATLQAGLRAALGVKFEAAEAARRVLEASRAAVRAAEAKAKEERRAAYLKLKAEFDDLG